MVDQIRRLSDELARDPSSLVFLPLSDALRRQGKLDLALKVALRGLERHPYVADAHDLLARIYADRGDLERAVDEWHAALRLAPAHRPARKGLAFVAYRRGHLEEAEYHLREAAAGDTDEAVEVALTHVREAIATSRRNGSGNGAPVAAETAPGPPTSSTQRNGSAARVSKGGSPTVAAAARAPRAGVEGAGASTRGASPASAAPDIGEARALFASLLIDAEQTALLLDADGLVLAGAYVDADGRDVSEEIGAELAGIGGEAERAMRHLGLGHWSSILVESDAAIVAMAPAARESLLLVASSRRTPVGLVRLLLDRAGARAREWLARIT